MQRPWRARLRLILLIVLVSGVGLVCTLILLFQHIPAWYRPTIIAPADLQRVKNDLIGTHQGFTDKLRFATGPFEYRLTEQQINAWLAAREQMWPPSREWLPSALSDPMMTVEDGAIRLAAVYRESGLKTVVSVRFNITGDANGIYIGLTDVSSGSLPVPISWVQGELAKLDPRLWPAGRMAYGQHSGPPLPALADIFEEATFSNAWIWDNGHIPFRVVGLTAEPGAVVFIIEPLPRQADNR